MSRRDAFTAVVPLVLLLGAVVSAQATRPATNGSAWIEEYREGANRLIGEATSDTFAWRRLAALTDTAGHRLSGSPHLDRAIQWAVNEMNRDGLENVHTEPVMVPKWVRGNESAEIVEPARLPMAILGRGGSVASPPGGIEARILVVRSFEDLDARSAQARGRIVVFNVAFSNYGETVRFRTQGASRASRRGAVAMLIRSVGPDGLRLPHTGVLNYSPDALNIPAASIASEDADRLQRMSERGPVTVRLNMEAHFEADAPSANVIGELRGRERPDEVVVVSGHLDSWDVGDGASDDGGGCVVTWEALRLMKRLGMRPRRTVRVVLWTNEENGGRGGLAYRDQHRSELAKHVMMLESDLGVFRPIGFGFTGSDSARQKVKAISSLLKSIGADAVLGTGDGADIAPSVQEARIPAMSLESDSTKLFLIHHTAADTVDKIDPAEMAKAAAAVTVMAWVVAELPERLSD